MANDIIRRTLSGEVLPPERHDILSESRQQLPYADPNELLQRMGGFIQRWSMRGRTSASVEITQQFERLYTSYLNLYQTTTRLTYARIEHGRAINELRYLDDILAEDNRRRRVAAEIAAERDEGALLQLKKQNAALRRQLSADEARNSAEKDAPDVPRSPSEQLREAATQRAELRKTINDLVAQVRREAGTNPLSPELDEEIQRINSEAEKLILYSGSER